MAYYAPHPNAAFEGYYSRFYLPSGWSVCLIVSTVPAAARQCSSSADLQRKKPYYIVFTYVSPHPSSPSESQTIIQKEFWPEVIDTKVQPDSSFSLTWDSGYLKWDKSADTVSWKLDTPEVRFKADTISGTKIPWKQDDVESTPAGIIASLPSPIQWHVQAVSEDCNYELEVDGRKAESGEAKVHYEKNWAVSFPKSYIWLQARDFDRQKGICIAGGSLIPGVQAYLVGYQGDQNRFHSYIPWSIFGVTLSGLFTEISYPKRRFVIDIKGWFRRLKVVAIADPDTWFSFAAPLAEGHRPGYTVQSYASTIEVEVYERSWPWQGWTKVEGEAYRNGALEFGGDCYKQHEE